MASRHDARRLWPGATLLGCAALLAGLSQSCAHPAPPPKQVEDICPLLLERADWYEAITLAGERWNVSPGALLAVIHQESRFRASARPWSRFLGLPLAPASSAYGYGQATDGTWRDYQRATGRRGARRDRFADAVDFVGWYLDVIHRAARIPKDDVYRLYLGYHEGPGGLARGSHLGKEWLDGVARRVAARAALWDRDAERCLPGSVQRAQGAGAEALDAAASPTTSSARAASSMATPGSPSATFSATRTRSAGTP